VLIEYSTTGQ